MTKSQYQSNPSRPSTLSGPEDHSRLEAEHLTRPWDSNNYIQKLYNIQTGAQLLEDCSVSAKTAAEKDILTSSSGSADFGFTASRLIKRPDKQLLN